MSHAFRSVPASTSRAICAACAAFPPLWPGIDRDGLPGERQRESERREGGRECKGHRRARVPLRGWSSTRFRAEISSSAASRDLAAGEETTEALLVSLASTKLRLLGLDVSPPLEDPELRLYRLLERDHGDAAHGRYNALVRRLVSFERALACVR